MDILITDTLLNVLMISCVLSVILMAVIQKFKALGVVRKEYQIFIANLFISFSLGIPFSLVFYNLDLMLSIWVCIFGFIGAPSIYEVLKKQNIINYTPKSLDDVIEVKMDNYIERDK